MDKLMLSLAGLPSFLLYFALALSLVAVFLFVYVRVTPYKEFTLIREGNTAAAVSLSGSLIGFILPLASAITHSVSPVDMLIWGLIALVVQILAFFIACRLVPGIAEAIPQGRTASATILAALSLGAGILNAACMTY
ncbi:hypothetical protein BURK2_02680 [Burkholderiales bacterium]|nr:MAG: DUF350 domain-containing protein [Burkholderiales bacterium]CAG0996013.1 hypothetical protein BURK2_02680 [Burkholderiales bacterium]